MDVIDQISEELGIQNVSSSQGLAKVSIVGTGMQDSPGYASTMFTALASSDINIEMITTSEIRITCIVAEAMVENSVRALHTAFQLDKEN